MRLRWPSDAAAQEAVWADRGCVLSQCCSLHLVGRLHRRMHVVGAFDFALPGVPPGSYASHLVTRIGDDRPLAACAARVAVNDGESQSGWGALVATGLPVGRATVTGSHAASMAALAAAEADLAAIDAVTWRLRPHPRLRVRRTTRPTPAPPLVTARPALVAPLRRALGDGVAALPLALRRPAGLRGFVPLDARAYRGMAVPDPP